MKFIFTFLFVFVFLCRIHLFANEVKIIAVGKADSQRQKIVFMTKEKLSVLPEKNRLSAKKFLEVLQNDFSFYRKYFEVVKNDNFVGSDISLWKKKSLSLVVEVDFKKRDVLSYNLKVHNISLGNISLSGSGVILKGDERRSGHREADRIYQAILNKESIFKSHIVFVSDRDKTRKRDIKELYISDFDGKNARRLTRHKGIVISPAVSKNGDKIIYSLISGKGKKKNINLRMLTLSTGKDSIISRRRGINSGAVFMDDEDKILLTLTHEGNAEIYIMNLKTKKLKRLTNNFAPDVDPSVNFTGDKMTFLSGRAGGPHIYIMDTSSEEKKVKRISFVGKYNATPRFSPDGKEIAFSSWLDKRFDIFRIDHNGRNLGRLTKDFGSNEDPTFSTDGEFIAFSSQKVFNRKKAKTDIWIMDREGELIGQITRNFGNCMTPRWSK